MESELLVALLVFPLLFALEGVVPFYAGRNERCRHALRNVSLALTAGIAGLALAPLVVFSVQAAADSGVGLCNASVGHPVLCAIGAFLLFDLWMYLWHRANHAMPLLWRFHRVHHTDPAMDSTTALRFHPGEIALSTLLHCVVLALLGMGLAEYVLYKSVMLAVILFHHGNVKLPATVDRALRWVIVTPSMHRVHHSTIVAETDSNYGTIFSIWDRLFGSFRTRRRYDDIRFGIGTYESPRWQGVLRLLALPFQPLPGRRSRGSEESAG